MNDITADAPDPGPYGRPAGAPGRVGRGGPSGAGDPSGGGAGDPDRPRPSRWGAAGLGVIAAGAALGTGELVSGPSERVPSLVLATAEVFVAETPGGVVRWGIDTFGASQKTLLVTGVVVVSLLLGAVGGVLARTRFAEAATGFAAFGAVGGWAAARGTLSSDVLSWLAAAAAAAVGVGVLGLALRPPALAREMFGLPEPSGPGEPPAHRTGAARASGPGPGRATARATGRGDGPGMVAPGPPSAARQRRWFLAVSGTAATYGLLGAGIGRRLRQGRSVEGARTEVASQLGPVAPPEVPSGVATFDRAVRGISPTVTPNDDFYRIDTALVVPQVDPASWRLRITGMVDREVVLTFDELLALDRIEEFVTLACVSNEVGGDLVGNARWSGVPLAGLLQRAGVRPEATQVVGRSVDGWTAGFPVEAALDGRPAMVAVAMNGEPLPTRHGFPARLIVPGLYGYVSATKWLEEIELTTWEAFDAYWIPRGWAEQGPIKTQSRIDVPRPGAGLQAGRVPVAGVAWAPTRAVSRVEVRVDDGPWATARLSDALSENTWVQWLYEWDATPGRHRLQVRATDGTGETQTREMSPPAPSGATGWHTVRVEVE